MDAGAMSKTVIFEEKYGDRIEGFSTTENIDSFIENKIDRKLRVIKLEDYDVVSSGGSIFKLQKYDIGRMFDETIKP